MIEAVRFGARTPQTIQQWHDLQLATARRLGYRAQAQRDRFLEGILRRVTTEAVEFEVDGDLLTVKTTKLDGVVYHHAVQVLQPTVARLATFQGGSLAASQIELRTDHLAITTPAGASFPWPLEQLQRIDFSQGKVVFLSELNWDARRSTWEPYFGRADQVGPLAQFYQPRRDVGFNGEPLQLAGQAFRRGLALHSRSDILYRLPDKFRRFVALVGIDDAVGDAGHVEFRILGDGRTLFEGTLAGSDDPLPLQIDIDGVRELQFVVDFGDDLDVGDCLSLGDARVIK